MSSPRRSNIASRYLQGLDPGGGSALSGSPTSTASRIVSSSSTSPLRENRNLLNSSRKPSLSPVKNAKVALSRSGTMNLSSTDLNDNNNSDDLDVHGLKGRKKLAKKSSDENLNASWFDNQRQSLQGYEYLCRVGEAKQWIEQCINEELPSESELCNDGLRDGVILAKLTSAFVPELVRKVVPASKRLQFKHTENINNFFKFLDLIQIPELFRFELTDLYDKKNIPKVIFCIHALSFLLAQDERAPEMTSLVGKLEFTDEEICASQKALDGANLPNFSSVKIEGSSPGGDGAKQQQQQQQQQSKSPSKGKLSRRSMFENNSDDAGSHSFSRSPTRQRSPRRKLPVIPEPEPVPEEPEDPEPTNEELEQVLKSVIKFQSLARGSIYRCRMFVARMVLKSSEPSFIQLQSIFRGKKLRQGPLLQELAVHSATPFIVELQALIRGAMTRKVLRHSIKKIYRRNSDHIVTLQSIIRGNLYREKLLARLDALMEDDSELSVIKLQAVMRRVLYANRYHEHLHKAFKAEKSLTVLQAIIRGTLVRKEVADRLISLEFTASSVKQLQSIIRRNLFNNRHGQKLTIMEEETDTIVQLQSKIRQMLYLKKLAQLKYFINKSRYEIIELQSIARAGRTRANLNVILDSLEFKEAKFTKFNAIVRGNLLRAEIARFKHDLHRYTAPDIVQVQALVRGLLSRFSQDMLLDDLDAQEDSVTRVQAAIRGAAVRRANRERDEYYLRNIDKIIKIQSFIKGKDFGDAYRKLLSMANPPLHVIAKFAYLLNDTDKDFQDEVRLNQLNEKILYKTKETEMLEQTNKELDIKIALLVKNKITLDELIRMRNNGYSGYKVDQGILGSAGGAITKAGNSISDINALDKSTRQRVELYQKVFYLLQTEPHYFLKLVSKYEFAPKSGTVLKEIQTAILKIFNYGGCSLAPGASSNNLLKGINLLSLEEDSSNRGRDGAGEKANKHRANQSPMRRQEDQQIAQASRREEYMFMRMLSQMVTSAVKRTATVDEFATNYIENHAVMWQKLFNAFIRTPKQRAALKSIFGSLISSISDIEGLSLESNPLKIYQSLLEDEGKPTGVASANNISVEEAIQIPKVRNQFVKNLAQLRELSSRFYELLWSKVHVLPVFLKALMSSIYTALKKQFQEAIPENVALSISGYVLVDLYVNSIIKSPEYYGITLTTQNSKTTLKLKENLLEITKLLSQMVLMAPFPIEEVYLQPLNDYIHSQNGLVEKILKLLANKENADIDRVYDMSTLHDLSNYKKPTLLMEVEDITKITKLINDNRDLYSPKEGQSELNKGSLTQGDDQVMIGYLDELCELAKTSRKSLWAGIGGSQFKLTLNPTVNDVLSAKKYLGSKQNALLIQAKRCVIYMMQVQTGKNLLELLLSKIKPADEANFKQIIQDEHREKIEKNIYTNAAQGSLGDLTKMTYHDLKCLALEKILELELMGLLMRGNNFQQLVNEIAQDIKAKKHQRASKQEQIASAEKILKQIQENESRLRRILDVYNDYIAKAVASLQSQPGKRSKKKKLFPFISKQYFYQRELRRQGKTPKFGSYKYSAKYLSDQGILAELKGVQCLALATPPELPKVDFMFSCDEVGMFLVEAASGSIPIPDAVTRLSLDDLLFSQYENSDYIEIYDGIVKFYTDTFLNFIFKKFYDNSDY